MNELNLELENFYTCDIRVGCIAVYRGPKVNCIEDAEGRYVFYANGVWDGHKWNVSEADIENAQRVAAELNALCCRAPLPDNKALTVEELRGMDGQPVYLAIGYYSVALEMWALVSVVDTNGELWLQNSLGGRSCYHSDADLQNSGIVAYRRPPERREP